MLTIKQKTLTKIWISLLCIGSLSGCASFHGSNQSEMTGGPSMASIYEQAIGQSNAQSLDKARAQVPQEFVPQAQVYRTTTHQVQQEFPTLPNPTIVMTVTPHLAGPDSSPVPGYRTAFSMYKANHYALPGEVRVNKGGR